MVGGFGCSSYLFFEFFEVLVVLWFICLGVLMFSRLRVLVSIWCVVVSRVMWV